MMSLTMGTRVGTQLVEWLIPKPEALVRIQTTANFRYTINCILKVKNEVKEAKVGQI